MIPLVPKGVTRRHLNTLISRGSPFSVGGKAVVACLHGKDKRQNTDHFVCDLRFEKPHLCPCCENFYAKPSDEPGFCPECTPGVKR